MKANNKDRVIITLVISIVITFCAHLIIRNQMHTTRMNKALKAAELGYQGAQRGLTLNETRKAWADYLLLVK